MAEPKLTAAAEQVAQIKIPWIVNLSALVVFLGLPILGALWIVNLIPVFVVAGWVVLAVILVMPTYGAIIRHLPVLPAPQPSEARLRNVMTPEIQGIAAQGGVLVCSTGQWEGAKYYHFQWEISTPDGFLPIEDANSYWLYLPQDFLGGMIRCQVSAADNTRPALSLPAGPVKETDKEVMRKPLAVDRLEAIARSSLPLRALLRIFAITLVIAIGHLLVHRFDLLGLG